MLLTANQRATRQALVDVAIELATEGGYDAVAMPEVARRAGMSTAKAYQHIGTKDQLLIEALLSLGRRSAEVVERHDNTGDTPAERLRWQVARIMTAVAERPLLYRALYRAYVTNGPAFEGDGAMALGLPPGRVDRPGACRLLAGRSGRCSPCFQLLDSGRNCERGGRTIYFRSDRGPRRRDRPTPSGPFNVALDAEACEKKMMSDRRAIWLKVMATR